MLDQAESLRRLASGEKNDFNNRKKARIITITSGKGGVGKSNFVVNLAISLQRQGQKVMIFDADIGMGNDDVLMGIYPKYNVLDLMKGGMSIEDVLVDGPEGIKLLPGGSGLNNIEDLQQNEREGFLEKIENIEGFDYIFIDTGAGISRSVLAFIACADDVIIVTTPEPTSLTDAYSLLKAVKYFKINKDTSIVVNRTFHKGEGEETFFKFQRAVGRFLKLETKYLGCIDDDRKLVMAVREQSPVVISYPNSNAAKCIKDISKKIINEKRQQKGSGVEGLFKRLFNIFS
ncbi:MinD/ParA family protein [Clostridium gasigenes]|uniref:Flagellar biosynthesis protein FlhG n=1 Tax=Clostridium gasigenes TaxID=94869 RepID=A0A1H0TUE9_9CLOT|nr:MinD/ParA family protein [Clostridium gasigenes]MBB6624246.1 MinD/ParA family protein [Clostridium gasigenes]MBB6714634.1 MinD/ParA family protein [Clostridium gasigenes]MBU3105294.1 MinD/ParA family protein [Clostridium gasigenes]MBU3132124.1 MinD/ParA family protein [Clostridium gasigenes]MBU3135961.1 MinD/ParA family protein [Clostridium gasigenes]